jgi:ankyrin repeat protein
MNREGKSANEAADRLIMSCLDRKWTMVTNTNELISILDNLARLSHGQAASFLYYRLLHSLGRPIPKILVDDARNQGILDLEYNLLSPFLSQAEHEYQRMRSYRKLRRSKADGATPEELAAEQARLGIPKENVAFTLWQCSALRHLFYSLDALIWLVQINAVSVLEDLLSQDCTLLNKDTESAHRLLIIACKTGHLKTMECLIRAGKLTFEDFEPPEGFTPFHFLSMFDHGDVGAAISLFLEAKYDIDAFIDKDNAIEYTFWPERELWGTPLCIAAMHDRKDIVHALLDNGADIRSAGRHRSSPINIAARYNRPDILELLCSKIKHKEDIEMNPLRTLTIGCPFAQELTNGRNKQHAIERTVTTLLKYDFDINEKIEKIPSLGYAIEMNVFERCLHDCDFTVDFGVLDALLDNGFNSELSVSSLPQYLGKHHEKIQVRLMDYLIERRLITASSDLLSLLCNLIYRGMAGALRVIMSRLPESRPILNESVSSRLPLTPFHLAVNIDADIDLMEVLLDFGGSMDDVMPNLNPETPGRPKTIFEEVATFGRSEVVDLFIDRGVELLPESLLALCSDRNFRVHGKHILNHLLRRSEADPDQFRHPRLVILLAEEVNNGFLYDRLLDIGVVSFNLDIILCLISFGVKLSEKLYQDFVLKLISHALIASCADEDTKNQYTKGKGFESMRQFLVAIWKLLIHWALQREGLEDDLAFSYLHWASMIFSPEIVRELIDGGADVFAKGSLGHTPLDVVALPYRTEVEDQLRVFSTLFGEQLAMTTPSTFISPSDLVPDPQTLRICLGKAMIGQLQFQLRKLTTLQILNDRMLSERSKVLGSSWDNEDDQIWVYISNFWVVAQGFEDAVYMKTWLETPTGEEDETYVSLMYPSPIII